MVSRITAVYNRRIIYLSQVKYLFRIIGAGSQIGEEPFFDKTITSHGEFFLDNKDNNNKLFINIRTVVTTCSIKTITD